MGIWLQKSEVKPAVLFYLFWMTICLERETEVLPTEAFPNGSIHIHPYQEFTSIKREQGLIVILIRRMQIRFLIEIRTGNNNSLVWKFAFLLNLL